MHKDPPLLPVIVLVLVAVFCLWVFLYGAGFIGGNP